MEFPAQENALPSHSVFPAPTAVHVYDSIFPGQAHPVLGGINNSCMAAKKREKKHNQIIAKIYLRAPLVHAQWIQSSFHVAVYVHIMCLLSY